MLIMNQLAVADLEIWLLIYEAEIRENQLPK